MMENTAIPRTLQRLLIIFGALLVISLLVSGFSAVYVTLAAPQRATYVPSTVGFEGQLADSQGTPVADGSYSITFSLYSAATGGSPIWSETQPGVQVKDGLYSVQLGSVVAFDADDFSGPRWLAVKVGSDAEMEPRIAVSAVPFALNAQQAQGLQGYDVADTAPQLDNALMWNGSEWAPQGMTFPDLAPVGSNASPNDLLANYRSGAILTWKANDTVEVSAGELMINGYMRRNTGSVDVKFTADAGGEGPNLGLEAGSSAQSNTTYYVYAVADDAENTFDLIISASGTAPTGVTNYRKMGWFETESGSTNIKKGSAANGALGEQFVPSARVYGTGNQTGVLSFTLERWDTDNIHSTTTNPSRLTAQTSGLYLIFGNVRWVSSSNTNYTDRKLSVRLNGSANIAYHSGYLGTSSNLATIAVTTVYYLSAGDYVELVGLSSNSNDYMVSNGNFSPEFGMVWMGP